MYNGNREQILREQGIQFTVFKCDKCGEFYEPYEHHTCHGKNSYILTEDDTVEPSIPLRQAISQVEEPKKIIKPDNKNDIGERVYRCYKKVFDSCNGYNCIPLNRDRGVSNLVGDYLGIEFMEEMYRRWLSEGNNDKGAV